MTNIEKYNQIFITTFGVKKQDLTKLNYQSVETWDSIGHMCLIAELEDTFNIVIDTDEIINFNSYSKGFDVLSKYGIRF